MPIDVSIHDVSPATETLLDRALGLCHARAITPALLVVPDFHGAAPLARHPDFCARLRTLQAAGHRIYLHGLVHESRPRYGGRGDGRPGKLCWLYAQRVVSHGEAEFADLGRGEAEERLERGEAALREAGLRIDGFVPPAWAMPSWLLPMLARRGYRYCEDRVRVFDPVAGRSRWSLLLNFAGRPPAKRLASVAWCRLVAPARVVLPARVAIHPSDLESELLCREVARLLELARRGSVTAVA